MITPEQEAAAWDIIKQAENERNTAQQRQRPPLGLMPVRLWQEERRQEVKDAIIRYVIANKRFPEEWLAELQTLNSWLQ